MPSSNHFCLLVEQQCLVAPVVVFGALVASCEVCPTNPPARAAGVSLRYDMISHPRSTCVLAHHSFDRLHHPACVLVHRNAAVQELLCRDLLVPALFDVTRHPDNHCRSLKLVGRVEEHTFLQLCSSFGLFVLDHAQVCRRHVPCSNPLFHAFPRKQEPSNTAPPSPA